MVNTLFNKVLGENEKCVFYFYLKAEGTFWSTQYDPRETWKVFVHWDLLSCYSGEQPSEEVRFALLTW